MGYVLLEIFGYKENWTGLIYKQDNFKEVRRFLKSFGFIVMESVVLEATKCLKQAPGGILTATIPI